MHVSGHKTDITPFVHLTDSRGQKLIPSRVKSVHGPQVGATLVVGDVGQGGRGEIYIGGAQQKFDKSSFIFLNFSAISNKTFKISAHDALT